MQMTLGRALKGYVTALPLATDVSMYAACSLSFIIAVNPYLQRMSPLLIPLANVGRPKEHHDKSSEPGRRASWLAGGATGQHRWLATLLDIKIQKFRQLACILAYLAVSSTLTTTHRSLPCPVDDRSVHASGRTPDVPQSPTSSRNKRARLVSIRLLPVRHK